MTQVIASVPDAGSVGEPSTPAAATRLALDTLPDEWSLVDRVSLGGVSVDHVVVGPNGVFTVAVDPDSRPATPADDVIYRGGLRITDTVKSALTVAHRLRRESRGRLFAYPILVTTLEGDRHQLDRLGVVPGERLAEYIWSHPGLPLRRSERIETLWALRRPAG